MLRARDVYCPYMSIETAGGKNPEDHISGDIKTTAREGTLDEIKRMVQGWYDLAQRHAVAPNDSSADTWLSDQWVRNAEFVRDAMQKRSDVQLTDDDKKFFQDAIEGIKKAQ